MGDTILESWRLHTPVGGGTWVCVNVVRADDSVFNEQDVTQTRGRGYTVVVNFDNPEWHHM